MPLEHFYKGNVHNPLRQRIVAMYQAENRILHNFRRIVFRMREDLFIMELPQPP